MSETRTLGRPPRAGARGLLAALPRLRRDERRRRAARQRLRAPRRLGHVYLDYTGGGLYARVAGPRAPRAARDRRLRQPALAQPDLAGGDRSWSRRRAPRCSTFFNADPRPSTTSSSPPNASGALKLVGESYPFARGRPLPAHLRQPQLGQRHPRVRARAAAPSVIYVPVARARPAPGREQLVDQQLQDAARRGTGCSPIPAQSNFSGVQHPLEWVDAGAASWAGTCCSTAAAFAPTNRLDLSAVQARLRAAVVLQDVRLPHRRRRAHRPARERSPSCAARGSPAARSRSRRCRATAGTTSRRATPGSRTARSTTSGCPAVTIGLEHLAERRHRRDPRARVALTALAARRDGARCAHSNGAPMVRVFGPETMDAARRDDRVLPARSRRRGLRRAPRRGARRAESASRCAPAASATPATARSRTASRATRWRSASRTPPRPSRSWSASASSRTATGKVPNTIRVSLGLASNFADVYRFMAFAESFRDR